MTYKKNKRIFISATEQSGDNIGFNIMKEILNIDSDITFDGVGGSKMSKYFSNQYFKITDFNSMGIFEIIFSLKKYIKMINFLIQKLLINNYDLLITIDSPDFNYPLIKKFKQKNKYPKVIHIVAPTVWAWRTYRAKKFSYIFDEILVLFKFEVKYFEKYNLKTTFIGHPVYYINNKSNLSKNKVNEYIAFLPGSRLSEVNKLLPFFNIAYNYLLENSVNIKIFIPTLPHLKNKISTYVKNWKIDTLVCVDEVEINEYYSYVTKAVVCSGTASLEIAKRNIPQIIIYKLNILTEYFLKNFIKVKFASIINIVKNKSVIPEIVNSKLNKESFLIEFKKLLYDRKKNSTQIIQINNSLDEINSDSPPYKIAIQRIISYL